MTPRQRMIAIKRALAEYVGSEGCSCCRNEEAHAEAKAKLGRLLRIPKYADHSGYDFARILRPPMARPKRSPRKRRHG